MSDPRPFPRERLAGDAIDAARALLGAHLVRHAEHHHAPEETRALFRSFLGEVDRLVAAIDTLRVP